MKPLRVERYQDVPKTKVFFVWWPQVVCEPRLKLSARDFSPPTQHITAGANARLTFCSPGAESQLCCAFNLQGPIWRHHRVMRSDTFPFLIAAAPVVRSPEGCSGQKGHKYFLMSINLITVLCKQGLCCGDR